MAKIKRIRFDRNKIDSSREAEYRKDLILKFVTLIEKVHQGFGGGRRYLNRMELHRTPSNPYSKIILKTIDFLLEQRGHHTNPIEYVMEDYIHAVYKHFDQYHRYPNIKQLSPSQSNRIRFIEFVQDWEASHDPDKYWVLEDNSDIRDAKRIAAESVKRAESAVGRKTADIPVGIVTLKTNK
jgi:hypothetical protein